MGSETSKVEQVGTEQAATVVWGSVLLRSPGSQSGHKTCLTSPQVLVRGLGCRYTTFLAVPGGKQLAVEGISDPVLAADHSQAFSGSRTKAPRAGEGRWKEVT